MGVDPQPLPADKAFAPRRRYAVRLIVAAAVTLAVLPYAWGRTVVFWMLTGKSEPLYLVLFFVGAATVILLTRRRGVVSAPRSLWLGALALAAAWVVVNGI